jgi:hypothetical protein
MAEQIEEIVKRGRWFFDKTAPAEVRIVRRNFTYPPGPDDELPEGCIGDVPPPYGPDAINHRYRRAVFLATYSSNQSSSRTSGAEIGPT